MKRTILFLLVVSMMFLPSCGLISSLKDLSNSAQILLDDASELLRLVDTKVESGELTRELGEMLDQRIQNLMNALEDVIETSGGVIYDVINGTLDNTFANLSSLIDQIKQGILDESLPNLIQTLSSQLQLQINLIASSVEDIIVIAFGNTFILVDKVTNSVIVISSIILLAIGLLIFGVVLLKQKQKPSGMKIAGLVLVGIYTVFFLCIILISPIRGYIIAGLDFGEKIEGVHFQPKIKGVVPEIFTIGKSKRIIVYGNHLDKMSDPGVHLYQGNVTKFTFPKRTIIEATRNKIILGNFEQNLNWRVPSYAVFKEKVIPLAASSAVMNQYAILSSRESDLLYPGRDTETTAAPPVKIRPFMEPSNATFLGTENIRRSIKSLPVVSLNAMKMESSRSQLMASIFGQSQGQQIKLSIQQFFFAIFKLPEGDFGLRVFDGDSQMESPQFITIFNPPPPPPKPDISPIDIGWTGSMHAIQGQDQSLTLRIGFKHPEEVKNSFSVRITSSPPIGTINHQVSQGDIAAASANNFVDVTTRSIRPSQGVAHTFQVQVDSNNRVAESNEGNNLLNKALDVKRYVYDAHINFTTFQSNKNMDDGDDDEYRLNVRVDVTGNPSWSFNYNKDGNPGHVYNVNKTRSYSGLKPGDSIVFYTSGYEYDSGLRDGDDDMGSVSYPVYLGTDPTQGRDSNEISVPLQAPHYTLSVIIRFTRRIV